MTTYISHIYSTHAYDLKCDLYATRVCKYPLTISFFLLNKSSISHVIPRYTCDICHFCSKIWLLFVLLFRIINTTLYLRFTLLCGGMSCTFIFVTKALPPSPLFSALVFTEDLFRENAIPFATMLLYGFLSTCVFIVRFTTLLLLLAFRCLRSLSQWVTFFLSATNFTLSHSSRSKRGRDSFRTFSTYYPSVVSYEYRIFTRSVMRNEHIGARNAFDVLDFTRDDIFSLSQISGRDRGFSFLTTLHPSSIERVLPEGLWEQRRRSTFDIRRWWQRTLVCVRKLLRILVFVQSCVCVFFASIGIYSQRNCKPRKQSDPSWYYSRTMTLLSESNKGLLSSREAIGLFSFVLLPQQCFFCHFDGHSL